MGFFDLLSDILEVVGSGVKRAAGEQQQRMAKEQLRTLRNVEANNPNMSAQQRAKFEDLKQRAESRASSGSSYSTSSYSSSSYSTVSSSAYEKTVDEWDMEWKSIGMLKDADLSPYSHCVGLYRHVIDGETMYVGRAVELNNGGFRKRLSDYRRDSDSARKHQSGQIIHAHLDEIETYILVVGDTTEAVEQTKKLEGQFIHRYNPPWNKQINI